MRISDWSSDVCSSDLFEQAGGSFNLYTDRYVDIGDVPASLFQSINPIYIIIFAPFFAALWQWLGKRGLEPSAPAKFALALAQVGLGFLVFVWGANSVGPEAMRSEEHTSELQSLMRISYAVFCLKKKKKKT